MTYAIGSLKFKTQAGLCRALVREGAQEARFIGETLQVSWPAGVCEYKHREGVFELQLRFDFYNDRRIA